jgi:small subunit ribosomal protein S3
MGQKTNPIGFRLGITKDWRSKWFATKEYPKLLKEDDLLRKYLRLRRFPGNASPAIADIIIERKPGKVVVTLHTGRPGVVIGKKGEEVEKLKSELQQITGKDVGINVEEIKRPEIEAQLVADNIAAQLAQRISFRRAMKRAVQSAMRMGAEGIKVKCGGRLGGAEIARVEGYREGRVPLHTLRADIDYATSTAKTTFGTIGVKVWIFKGEMVEGRRGGSTTYSSDA